VSRRNFFAKKLSQPLARREVFFLSLPKIRDVMLTKKVWERIQRIAVLKQLQTYFKTKREKGVRTPFPHFPACSRFMTIGEDQRKRWFTN